MPNTICRAIECSSTCHDVDTVERKRRRSRRELDKNDGMEHHRNGIEVWSFVSCVLCERFIVLFLFLLPVNFVSRMTESICSRKEKTQTKAAAAAQNRKLFIRLCYCSMFISHYSNRRSIRTVGDLFLLRRVIHKEFPTKRKPFCFALLHSTWCY